MINKKINKKILGNAGEDFAAVCLQSKNYKILARNFRFGRNAEIDIIAEINGTIIFVEVKTRNNKRYGTPAEGVTFRKQQKIIKAATKFLQINNLFDRACRFDIFEVFANNNQDTGSWEYNHIENAFEIV